MNEMEEQLYSNDRAGLAYEIGWWSADVEHRMLESESKYHPVYNDSLKTAAKILFHYANRFLTLVEKESQS